MGLYEIGGDLKIQNEIVGGENSNDEKVGCSKRKNQIG
jgi:hypothetical protein